MASSPVPVTTECTCPGRRRFSTGAAFLPPLPSSRASYVVRRARHIPGSPATAPLSKHRVAPTTRVNPTRRHVLYASAEIPMRFNLSWYNNSTTPFDIEIASQHIPHPDRESAPTDFHFISREKRLFAVIDYPHTNANAPESPGQAMIDFMETRLTHNSSIYPNSPVLDLNHVLSDAMHEFGAPPGFSAVLVDASTNFLRLASIGPSGIIVIRGDNVIYRSYPNTAAALIAHVARINPEHSPVQSIHTDFIELEPSDLVLVATDGLFSNLDEKQILAFVRPVPDPIDTTLSIANNTCLGSWTSDDAEFIAYYLTSLAANFATAANSTPIVRYPFPPSPNLDDITVLCLSCAFTV